jgi:hypothetical protein
MYEFDIDVNVVIFILGIEEISSSNMCLNIDFSYGKI